MKKVGYALGGVLAFIILFVIVLRVVSPSAKSIVDTFQVVKSQQPNVIYDMNGRQIESGSGGDSKYRYLPLARMPAYLKNAFLSAQDPNYYRHSGTDLVATIKALHKRVKGDDGRYVGYTIDQRFVASVLYGDQPQGMWQKLMVYFTARKLEGKYSKDEILEYFLNGVQLDQDVRGVETAAVMYFGKSCTDINEAEASFLAAMAALPVEYDIRKDFQAIKSRQLLIIQEMAQNQFVNFKDISYWYKKPIRLNGGSKNQSAQASVSALSQYVLGQVAQLKLANQSGLEIHTTLDVNRLKLAEEFEKEIRERGIGFTNPMLMQVQLLDVDPMTGGIRALFVSGSETFGQNIEIGEKLKDPALAAAVAGGNDLLSKISWDKDTNYDSYFSAPYDLTAPYPEKIQEYLSGVGITVVDSENIVAQKIPLEEVVQFTMPFMNGGEFITPYVITKIQNVEGQLLYERAKEEPRSVLNPTYAYVVRTMWNHNAQFNLKVGNKTALVSGFVGPRSNDVLFQAVDDSNNLLTLWAGQSDGKGKVVNRNSSTLIQLAKYWNVVYGNVRRASKDDKPPAGVTFKKIRRANWGISSSSQVRNIPILNL